MTPQKISAGLVIALAAIAAVVATGLIAGYVMQPWIVAYWVVLTAKNIVDYIGAAPHQKKTAQASADLAEVLRKALEACRQYRITNVYGNECVIHEEDV